MRTDDAALRPVPFTVMLQSPDLQRWAIFVVKAPSGSDAIRRVLELYNLPDEFEGTAAPCSVPWVETALQSLHLMGQFPLIVGLAPGVDITLQWER